MAHKIVDLDSITIADDYMFVSVFSDPERCRKLLERVLSMRIRKVVMTSGEKTLAPEIASHGIRMDVYAEDDANTVYDVEMQHTQKGDLALRSRYYQSIIDADLLKRGQPYQELRRSFVVFICTHDPFRSNLAKYEFKLRCIEADLPLHDLTSRVFVNASAWERCDDPQLRAFLRYLQNGIMEDEDEFLLDVDAAVQRMRARPEWRTSRMNFEQYILAERYEAKAEGKAEDRAELARLSAALRKAGRLDEFWAALEDESVAKRLLEEFGIGNLETSNNVD